jgi:hypothetical protein
VLVCCCSTLYNLVCNVGSGLVRCTSMGSFVERFEGIKKGGCDIKGDLICYLVQHAERGSADVFQGIADMLLDVLGSWYSPVSPTTIHRSNLLSKDYDLKLVPIFRYVGNEANEKGKLSGTIKSKIQSIYHCKAPVGTLGF